MHGTDQQSKVDLSKESIPADTPVVAINQDGQEMPIAAGYILRLLLGGTLMGLANLVPGISGGTMLVSAGVYPRFVAAVAELSTFRFRMHSLLTVGCIAAAAATAILLLAGTVKTLVVDQRWIMYSLFIGLTLGGVPIVWRMARPVNNRVWIGAVFGFLIMALLALTKAGGASSQESSPWLLAVAGLAGSSAMILPGVSGGYLLLLLGQYVPILSGIDAFKSALRSGDLEALMEPTLGVVLPVGIGVLIGVVVVSNAVRWLLVHYQQATLGFLLGLLVGAVLGIWPFQHTIEPELGQTVIKGQVVTAENRHEFSADDLPTDFFTPSGGQVVGSLGLILIGLCLTTGVSYVGREESSGSPGE